MEATQSAARRAPVRQNLGSELHGALAHHPSLGPMLRRVLDRIDQMPATDLQREVSGLWRSVVQSTVNFGALFPGELEQTQLGVVLRRRDEYDPTATRTLNLESARQTYLDPPFPAPDGV